VFAGKLIEREGNFEENLLLLSQIFGCQLIYSLIINPKLVSLMTINKTSIIATTTQLSTLLPHRLSNKKSPNKAAETSHLGFVFSPTCADSRNSSHAFSINSA
jgi:hypothetical protein